MRDAHGRAEPDLPRAEEGLSMPELDVTCPLYRVNDAAHSVESEAEGGETCAICMDALELEQRARRLPCTHVYHDRCAVLWLGMSNRCPVCVRPVVVRDAVLCGTARDPAAYAGVHVHAPATTLG